MKFINISAYKFMAVPDPAAWQPLFKEKADALSLKGTILISPEGVNLFLAAPKEIIDEYLDWLRVNFLGDEFGRQAVIGHSDHQPFGKMVVRLTREIITMRHPTIKPSAGRAPFVSPTQLRQWLDKGVDDQGREVVLLDTRNDFEVKIGTFEGAKEFDIEKFSQFPEALKKSLKEQQEAYKDKTIVSFCTGGIRCEKAVLYMQELDIPHVYQLDGGILRYFEEVGGAHWLGECFVFDERVAVDPQLKETKIDYEGRTKKSAGANNYGQT